MPVDYDTAAEEVYGGVAPGQNAIARTEGVTPEAASSALASAPMSGQPPGVAMQEPQLAKSAALAETQRRVLEQSPPVARWVASADPAHVAAVKEQLPALRDLHLNMEAAGFGQSFEDLAYGLKGGWQQLQLDLQRMRGEVKPGVLTGQNVLGVPLEPAMGVLGLAMAPASVLTEPVSRLFAAATGLSIEQARQSVGLASLLIPGEGVAGARGAVSEAGAGPAAVQTGTPHLGPDGRWATTPEGYVADKAGVPVTFPDQKAAGLWYQREGYGVPTDQRFEVANAVEGPGFHAQEVERLRPPVVDVPALGVHPGVDAARAHVADLDAQAVAALQDHIATSKLEPSAVESFVASTHPNTVVTLDPDRLLELGLKGEVPFPELGSSLLQSAQEGTDVTVPLGRYLAATAGKPYAPDLNASATFRVAGTSVDAAKEAGAPVGTVVPPVAGEAGDLTPPEQAQARDLTVRYTDALDRVGKEHYLAPLFADPKAVGMTADQFARYSEGVGALVQEASDRAYKRAVAQVRRERGPDFKAAVELHSEAARKELEAQPTIDAMRALRDLKLNRAEVQAHPEGADVPANLQHTTGLPIDQAAELTGHPSGASLVHDIATLSRAVRDSGAKGLEDYLDRRAKAIGIERARAEGYDATPEALHRAASEMVNGPALTEHLSKELQALADAEGIPLDEAQIRAYAARRFANLPVSSAFNIRQMEGYVYKGGVRAEKALLKGDTRLAFIRKQQQFLHHLQLREAHTFARDYRRASRMFNQLAKKPAVKGMDQEARNQARAVVASLGIPVRTGKFEGVQAALKGVTLEGYVSGLRDQGLTPPYYPPPSPMPEGGIPALTTEQFRGVASMVEGITELGREAGKVKAGAEQAELAQVTADIRANATAIGRPFQAGELRRLRTTLLRGAPAKAARAVGSVVARPETYLYWLDREANGPLMRYVVNPLQEGKYFKADKLRDMGKAFGEFSASQPSDWAKSLEARVDVPELTYSVDASGAPVPWLQRRGDVVMMATHFGTESNLAKLTEGFGWDEATVRAVADRVLSKADWDYVQFVLDQHHTLLPEVRELYRATNGLAMKEEPAIPIPTPHGTLRGGYRHIDYDWNAIGEFTGEDGEPVTVKDPNALGNSDLFGHDYRVATPANSYTLARTAFSAPLNLDHSTVHRELEAVVHDLAFRRPLIQAAKVLRQAPVRQAIREALGPEYLTETNQWLRDVARQAAYDQSQLKFFASMVRGFRRRFTMVQIGYNVATLLKHAGIAASHIAGEVGAPEFARAMGDLAQPHWRDFVDANSGEVRNALVNLDRDVRELIADTFRKQGFIEAYKYNAFTMFALAKQVEARATWLAKYRMLGDQGTTQADAIALANKAVRDTQGAGHPVDLPSLWRGDTSFWAEAGKLLNVFTNFENTQTNRMWTMMRRTPRMVQGFKDSGWAGGRRDFNKNFTDSMAYLVLPALYVGAFTAVTTGHWKDIAGYMGDALFKGVLGGTVPGGNMLADIPRAAKARDHSIGDDPVGSAMKDIISTGVDAHGLATHQQAVDPRWVEHATNTAGYITGLPSKPVSKAGQYVWDYSHGKVQDHGPVELIRGLLFGPKPGAVPTHTSHRGTHHR